MKGKGLKGDPPDGSDSVGIILIVVALEATAEALLPTVRGASLRRGPVVIVLQGVTIGSLKARNAGLGRIARCVARAIGIGAVIGAVRRAITAKA